MQEMPTKKKRYATQCIILDGLPLPTNRDTGLVTIRRREKEGGISKKDIQSALITILRGKEFKEITRYLHIRKILDISIFAL